MPRFSVFGFQFSVFGFRWQWISVSVREGSVPIVFGSVVARWQVAVGWPLRIAKQQWKLARVSVIGLPCSGICPTENTENLIM